MQLTSDLREFIASLNSNGVEYLVVGGLAVAFHGAPRYTGDLDFFVKPSRGNAVKVIQAIADFGLGGLRLTPDDLSRPDQIVQFGVKPNRIDLITSLAGVSFEEAWKSRIAGQLDGVPTQYIGRDALIRNKEATGRPQDLVDADKLRKRAKLKGSPRARKGGSNRINPSRQPRSRQ